MDTLVARQLDHNVFEHVFLCGVYSFLLGRPFFKGLCVQENQTGSHTSCILSKQKERNIYLKYAFPSKAYQILKIHKKDPAGVLGKVEQTVT